MLNPTSYHLKHLGNQGNSGKRTNTVFHRKANDKDLPVYILEQDKGNWYESRYRKENEFTF